jgi:hypothetical protein
MPRMGTFTHRQLLPHLRPACHLTTTQFCLKVSAHSEKKNSSSCHNHHRCYCGCNFSSSSTTREE